MINSTLLERLGCPPGVMVDKQYLHSPYHIRNITPEIIGLLELEDVSLSEYKALCIKTREILINNIRDRHYGPGGFGVAG